MSNLKRGEMKVNNFKIFILFLLLTFLSLIPNLLFSQVDTAWVRRYNGPGNSDDGATSLFVDNQSNVYVTGYSYDSVTDYDYATLKYDRQGNLLWERRYDGPGNGWDRAISLFVDMNSNVYVTGGSEGSGTFYDYATLKYDRQGNLLWERRYNGPGNDYDGAKSLFVDNQGNVYVTGGSYDSLTNFDYTTLKYDASGNLLWERRYNGQGNYNDGATSLFIDNQGNVYVTGRSEGSGTDYDYATLKYDANGNLLWERRYNGPGNSDDWATSLFVDMNGNVYVTGGSYDSLTNFDYTTLKYNANGNLLWERRYNGPGNDYDGATSLFVDNQSNVYVTGHSWGSGTHYDYATIKYIQEIPSIGEEKENKSEKKLTKKKIYDISGKLVKEKKLKKGIYFKETQKGIKKIIILK